MSRAYSHLVLDLPKVLMLVKMLQQPLQALHLFISEVTQSLQNAVSGQKKHVFTPPSSCYRPYPRIADASGTEKLLVRMK